MLFRSFYVNTNLWLGRGNRGKGSLPTSGHCAEAGRRVCRAGWHVAVALRNVANVAALAPFVECNPIRIKVM